MFVMSHSDLFLLIDRTVKRLASPECSGISEGVGAIARCQDRESRPSSSGQR